MTIKIRGIFILAFASISAIPNGTFAQQSDKGSLTGSFETNSIYYVPDSDLNGYTVPKDRIGSNNFVKLDYTIRKLSAGLQYEIYAPVVQGFSPELKDGKIVNKYISWTDKDFAITVGDFYEQFGSGMVLRTYEDRALGFNNAIEGVRASYNYNSIVQLKGLWGRPRLYMDYADVWVRGADVSFSISTLAKWTRDILSVGGSFVNKYEEAISDITTISSPNTDLWAGRVAYENHIGFFLRGEYLKKKGEIVAGIEDYEEVGGNGQLIEAGYNSGGLGVTATYRRIKNLNSRIMLEDNSINNVLNYIPSLTRQYPYMLANIEPHTTHTEGEQGGQFDLFYHFAKGSVIGGKYGAKVHLNASAIYSEEKSPNDNKYTLLYRDLGLDIEKQWNRRFKTTLLYSMQQYNPAVKGIASDKDKHVSHIFVADLLYKFNRKTSVRTEVQYLYSEDGTGDWVAALAELNVAPRFSLFVSNMYNHDSEEVHYYNGGVSYSHSRTRVALSFGRSRAGYVCSGGICRVMPAYAGLNLMISTSF